MAAMNAKKKTSEKRREISRDAARQRRNQETNVFVELQDAVPIVDEPKVTHVDRIALLRLSASYIKFRQLAGKLLAPKMESSLIDSDVETTLLSELFAESQLGEFMKGFLMVMDSQAYIIYISPNVSQCLGLTQTDLVGHCLFEFLKEDDIKDMQHVLDSCQVDSSCKTFTRMKSVLGSRGRSLNLRSALFKTIAFSINKRFIDLGTDADGAATPPKFRHMSCSPSHATQLMSTGAIDPQNCVDLSGCFASKTDSDDEPEDTNENFSPSTRSDPETPHSEACLAATCSTNAIESDNLASPPTREHRERCKSGGAGDNGNGPTLKRKRRRRRERSLGADDGHFFLLHGTAVTQQHPMAAVSACASTVGASTTASDSAAPAGVITDSGVFVTRHSIDMKFSFCHERMSEFLGYDIKTLMGVSFYSMVHPEDLKELRDDFKQIYQKQQITTGPYRLMIESGGYIWLSTEATVLTQGNRGNRGQQSIQCVHHIISGPNSKEIVADLQQEMSMLKSQQQAVLATSQYGNTSKERHHHKSPKKLYPDQGYTFSLGTAPELANIPLFDHDDVSSGNYDNRLLFRHSAADINVETYRSRAPYVVAGFTPLTTAAPAAACLETDGRPLDAGLYEFNAAVAAVGHPMAASAAAVSAVPPGDNARPHVAMGVDAAAAIAPVFNDGIGPLGACSSAAVISDFDRRIQTTTTAAPVNIESQRRRDANGCFVAACSDATAGHAAHQQRFSTSVIDERQAITADNVIYYNTSHHEADFKQQATISSSKDTTNDKLNELAFMAPFVDTDELVNLDIDLPIDCGDMAEGVGAYFYNDGHQHHIQQPFPFDCVNFEHKDQVVDVSFGVVASDPLLLSKELPAGLFPYDKKTLHHETYLASEQQPPTVYSSPDIPANEYDAFAALLSSYGGGNGHGHPVHGADATQYAAYWALQTPLRCEPGCDAYLRMYGAGQHQPPRYSSVSPPGSAPAVADAAAASARSPNDHQHQPCRPGTSQSVQSWSSGSSSTVFRQLELSIFEDDLSPDTVGADFEWFEPTPLYHGRHYDVQSSTSCDDDDWSDIPGGESQQTTSSSDDGSELGVAVSSSRDLVTGICDDYVISADCKFDSQQTTVAQSILPGFAIKSTESSAVTTSASSSAIRAPPAGFTVYDQPQCPQPSANVTVGDYVEQEEVVVTAGTELDGTAALSGTSHAVFDGSGHAYARLTAADVSTRQMQIVAGPVQYASRNVEFRVPGIRSFPSSPTQHMTASNISTWPSSSRGGFSNQAASSSSFDARLRRAILNSNNNSIRIGEFLRQSEQQQRSGTSIFGSRSNSPRSYDVSSSIMSTTGALSRHNNSLFMRQRAAPPAGIKAMTTPPTAFATARGKASFLAASARPSSTLVGADPLVLRAGTGITAIATPLPPSATAAANVVAPRRDWPEVVRRAMTTNSSTLAAKRTATSTLDAVLQPPLKMQRPFCGVGGLFQTLAAV